MTAAPPPTHSSGRQRDAATKRMIYYYFGGKEQLFTAVLERAYAVIRQQEQGFDVGHLDPVVAIRRLAELTFDHYEEHPDFIRLVSRPSTPPSWAGGRGSAGEACADGRRTVGEFFPSGAVQPQSSFQSTILPSEEPPIEQVTRKDGTCL